jgi:alpha-1,3-glucan synthase
VQDRLREWVPSVGDKIKQFSCLAISMLDIDGIRVDKATQVTPDYLASWGQHTRACAQQYGKNNFFIPGEVTGGDTFGAIYIGRGRQPNQRPQDLPTGLTLTNTSSDKLFLRPNQDVAVDSVAFHYSLYRSLTRFLGMSGNLVVAFDTPVDFIDMWNTMAVTNDFVNSQTGHVDPRHMYGTTNQDVFRWPSIFNGTQLQNLASFTCALIMPGIHTVQSISVVLTTGTVGRRTRIPFIRQYSGQLYVRTASDVSRYCMARSRLLQTQFHPISKLRRNS